MRALFVGGLLLICSGSPVWAHPAVGIVMDPQGNVFYSDLVHVWRIGPDGKKSIAVRDVHTHELAIDSLGNVSGEDSEYLGGDRYRHRIWQLSPEGRIRDVVPWRPGFWREHGFIRDSRGATYWSYCPAGSCEIRKRTPEGRISTVAPGVRFNHRINWIAAARDGSLYVVDGSDLRRISPEGQVTIVKRDLGPQMMGLWLDARNNVFVAVYGSRAVLRVSPDGRVATVARTPEPWGPSGVLIAPNGDLWILEYSTSNQARVRRIGVNGRATIY